MPRSRSPARSVLHQVGMLEQEKKEGHMADEMGTGLRYGPTRIVIGPVKLQ